MKLIKSIYIIILVLIIIAAALYGITIFKKRHLLVSFVRGAGNGQPDRLSTGQGGNSQSGDLCGGTGGIGQIISVEENMIIIKRRDGSSQTINLTGQTMIKISTGSSSVTDLKIGERVTIVGKPNFNGSETAATILVCKV